MAVLSAGYRPLACCPAQRAGAQRLCALAHSRRSARSACGLQWGAKRVSSKPLLSSLHISSRQTPPAAARDGKRQTSFADPAITRSIVAPTGFTGVIFGERRYGALGRMNARAPRLNRRASSRVPIARRGAAFPTAPDRERSEHLQPQSDHDRGAVFVPRYAASPRSGG